MISTSFAHPARRLVRLPALGQLPTKGPAREQARKQLLLISYTFPPVGGAGVQRAAKFAKYLPAFGWIPTVVTVENPSVPLLDESLDQDRSEWLSILRVKTWEPSYATKRKLLEEQASRTSKIKRVLRNCAVSLLQPDSQLLWCLPAYRAICRLLHTMQFDAMLVTGPPFSTFAMARRISRRFGLPLMLDFRDEWLLSSAHLENQHSHPWIARYQLRLFERVIKAAQGIVATTRASAAQLQAGCHRAGSKAVVRTIYNGFDPADFIDLPETPLDTTRFRLVYNGTLWNLTDVTPLVLALQSLARRNRRLCGSLDVVFMGRKTPGQQKILEAIHALPCRLIEHDYLPHRESLAAAKGSDMLCLLLADRMGAERVVPAKLFEYLALRRPVLTIAPPGEVHDLVLRHGHPHAFTPDRTEAIALFLEAEIERKQNRQTSHDPPSENQDLDWCTRSSLTKELAMFLDEICLTRAAH